MCQVICWSPHHQLHTHICIYIYNLDNPQIIVSINLSSSRPVPAQHQKLRRCRPRWRRHSGSRRCRRCQRWRRWRKWRTWKTSEFSCENDGKQDAGLLYFQRIPIFSFLSIFSWVWTNKSMVSQIGNVSYNDPNNSPTWSFQVQKHHSGIWQWTTAPCFHSQIIWQMFPFHCQVGVPSSTKMVRLIVEIAKIPWIHRPACQLLHPQGAAARCLAWKGLGRSEFLIHVFEDRFSNIAMNIHKTTSHFDMNITVFQGEPSHPLHEASRLHFTKTSRWLAQGKKERNHSNRGLVSFRPFLGRCFQWSWNGNGYWVGLLSRRTRRITQAVQRVEIGELSQIVGSTFLYVGLCIKIAGSCGCPPQNINLVVSFQFFNHRNGRMIDLLQSYFFSVVAQPRAMNKYGNHRWLSPSIHPSTHRKNVPEEELSEKAQEELQQLLRDLRRTSSGRLWGDHGQELRPFQRLKTLKIWRAFDVFSCSGAILLETWK